MKRGVGNKSGPLGILPRPFRAWLQGQISQGEYLIVYRGLSDKQHEQVMKDGFLPSPGEDKVYTATTFGEALRFAYSHVKEVGGNPIVYELKVPLSRFESQICYEILGKWKPTGYLTSGPLEPALITNVIRATTYDDWFKLLILKEKEEKLRSEETRRMLSKIPEEKV